MRAPSSVSRLGLRTWILTWGLVALLCPLPQVAGADALTNAWRNRISAAYEEVADAQLRAETARNTYQDWRQRKYPRGMRKKELVREVVDRTRIIEWLVERLHDPRTGDRVTYPLADSSPRCRA